ncbi:unnamed protein product [Nyctereutes procyonoides]|uniref:2'-deoxynucleoside 5'-phosphate N-hydrolase 1 n=1 Tax=Nyctereutes procyonoides TaxID=34880 RepID=A0A811YNX7_NYCPR|nr:unnamed protein product [Nyctereutes procyonoides]
MAAAAAAGARERGEQGQPGRPGQPGRRALYFCGSIRGGREDRALYGRIVSRLRRFGAVLTEHVAAAELGARGEEAAGGDRLIYERDLAWLQQADVVVAEVTQPSLGVGYELGQAVALNKRILCLFRPQSGRGEHSKPWMAPPSTAAFCRPSPQQLPRAGVGALEYSAHLQTGQGRKWRWGVWMESTFAFSALAVLSAMIRGAADGSRFQVLDYEEGQVEAMLDQYFGADPP